MSFSDQLKQQLDIVDVVGQYVRLKRQGSQRRYIGLCPFHSEKTPSFHVDGGGQYFYCFGCQAGGDVFRFVMNHDHLTFPEALKTLADRYGIAMPERERLEDGEAQKRAALLDLHEAATELFQQNLRASNGVSARDYLARRGVTAAALSEFRLGLSDSSGRQIVQQFRSFGPALLEASGLVLRRESDGSLYDRFRGRLMFPIHNENGRVIAFGGRALREGDEPKYLNSAETAIYKKSAVLYNLHRAKIDARKNDRMLLVEGYMDVIGVYSAGIKEVVASSGTALSIEQVRSLKRQVSVSQGAKGTVLLCFDPDEAGKRSTEKYIQLLLAEDLRVRVVKVAGDLDPDEFIQQNGIENFRKLMDGAESYFHWLADRARSKFDMFTAEGRVDAFQYLKPALQLINDRMERGAIASELAEYLNVDRQVIHDTFRPSPANRDAKPTSYISAAVNPNEKILLACVLVSEDARHVVRDYFAASKLEAGLELRAIFEAISATEVKGQIDTNAILEQLSERDRKLFLEIFFTHQGQTEEGAPQQALHCLEALEATLRAKQRDVIKRQIREAEAAGDVDRAMKMFAQLRDLSA